MTVPTLGAVEWGGDFVVPELEELFEWPAYWFSQNWAIGPISLSVNRVVLLSFLASGIACLLFFLAFRSPKLIPGRFQSAMEALVGFVRENIAMDAIGPRGAAFAPFLTTIFVFVLISNFFKITPLIQFPTTGRMALPAFLAILVLVVFNAVGIRQSGLVGYLRNALFPPGVPAALYLIVTPIELVSTFVVRPLTLAIRLFANMLAGHIILALTFVTAHAYFAPGQGAMTLVGIGGVIVGPIVVGFELMVVMLQAYIFTILTAVYIGGALNPEH